MLTLRDLSLFIAVSQTWCLDYLCVVRMYGYYVVRMQRFLEFIIIAKKILTDTGTEQLNIEL